MTIQYTLSIIKPDATERNLTGKINAKFEEAGLKIVAQRRMQLSEKVAGEFYAVHRERPFYDDLVKFMISGPVIVQVLKAKMQFLKIAKSWVLQTQQMLMLEQFVKNLLFQLKLTQFMDLIAKKMLRMKFLSSSLVLKL